MKDSIILLSGGMDSTTLLNEYKDRIKYAISFNYGSKHNEIELRYATLNCKKLNINHIIINLDFIKEYFSSSLLKGDIPEGHYEDETMKSTVVPFRNGIMLSIVAGIAESNNCKFILIANHHGDHAIYPDCREDFINYFNNAIKSGTYNEIEIIAPYTLITKRDIALKGEELGIDYTLTYSCYNGGGFHCGKCGSCVERKEALEGFDKTIYTKISNI